MLVYAVLGLTIFLVAMWYTSEFYSPRWLRLGFGTVAILGCSGIVFLNGVFQRMELEEQYRSASCRLAAAGDTAIKSGRAEHVAATLAAFRKHAESYPVAPADFYQEVKAGADHIESPDSFGP